MAKILCIGAHNDEIMADMGGTAYLLHKVGCETMFLNIACLWNDDHLSDSEKDEYRQQEFASAEELGGTFRCIGDRDALLFTANDKIIREITEVILDFAPDIVFIHWPKDNHVEHREAAAASYKALCVAHVRGARIKEIYAFDTGANQAGNYFNPDFAVEIGTEGMEAILRSVSHYRQNHANGTLIGQNNRIRKRYRGHQFGVEYAEVFKIVKFPNGSDDFLLKQLLGTRFLWDGNGMYPAFGEYYF